MLRLGALLGAIHNRGFLNLVTHEQNYSTTYLKWLLFYLNSISIFENEARVRLYHLYLADSTPVPSTIISYMQQIRNSKIPEHLATATIRDTGVLTELLVYY